MKNNSGIKQISVALLFSCFASGVFADNFYCQLDADLDGVGTGPVLIKPLGGCSAQETYVGMCHINPSYGNCEPVPPPAENDNCPTILNSDQLDTDSDGIGDVCENPGYLDFSFNTGSGASGGVYTSIVQADGKIIIGGNFTTFNGSAGGRIVRLNANGSVDSSFNPGTGANNYVYASAIQADGKIIIAGSFTDYNGTTINRIARLNADGSLDGSFSPASGANAINNTINSIAVLANGKIVIGGAFTSINGGVVNRIARLNADGSLDTSFNSGVGAGSFVRAVAVQTNGKVVIGGDFTTVAGATRYYIARLNEDGSLDTSFDPGNGVGPNISVNTVALQMDGKIIMGGYFGTVNTVPRSMIARLNVDGSLDSGFNPGSGANNTVYASAVQADGKIIIGGFFTTFNGSARSGIARLNADGSIDSGFNPGSGVSGNGEVRTMAVQADGKCIIGGIIYSYGGTVVWNIARIHTADTDIDGDTILDVLDNCPLHSNLNQLNTDGDTQGNVCDTDDDNDGVLDAPDKFPLDPAESIDTDNDGIGNNADTDDDGDTVPDGSDNCPINSNLNQLNTDGDAQGDTCDNDDDNDTVADSSDKFPLNIAASSDSDNDGYPGSWNAGCNASCQSASGLVLDNCPLVNNPTQVDTNSNGVGDACDGDVDGDGVPNASDAFPTNPLYSLDSDHDTLPDDWELARGRNPAVADYTLNTNCVRDDQGTKYWNGGSGNCDPATTFQLTQVYIRTWQTGGVCGSFISKVDIRCTPSISSVVCRKDEARFSPMGPICSTYLPGYVYSTTPADTLVQFAIIGTGVNSMGASYSNYCLLDRNGVRCYTGNGNDNFVDGTIAAPVATVFDSDGDGVARPTDSDDLDPLNPWVDADGDTLHDTIDNCPIDANADQLNTDDDAQGNVCDSDDDNDSILDINDVFPIDTDNDSIANNIDADDDNDGMPDTWEKTYGFNPLVNDASADADNDGITNVQEYSNGSNPTTVVTVKNDYTDNNIAGWYWKGQSNGMETYNEIWQLTFPLYSENWAIPSRFYPPPFLDQANWDIVTTGDFNKDGDADILWRHNTLATWKVWQIQNGQRVAQNTPADFDLAHEWQVIGAGDTDKDGDDDVILNNTSTGEVLIWEMQNHAIAATHNIGSKVGYVLNRIGDFNKDGDVDLLFRQNGTDVLITWELEANAFVTERALAVTGAGYSPVCAGDFDGDGDDDIMLMNSSTTQEKWFVMENYTRTQAFGSLNTGFEFQGCGDYDGDGDADMKSIRISDSINRIVLQTNVLQPGLGFIKQTVYTNPYGNAYGFVYRGNSN